MPGSPAVAAQMRKHAALMRRRGLRVSSMPGWETRGRSADFHPRALTYHHTAAAVDVDRLLRDGRPDLEGPLCNYALHRDGSWVLVAAGRANHAGEGTLPSSASYGIEATGPNRPGATGPSAFDNYAEYVLGVACIFEVEGWDASNGFGHKETARPVGRKVNPAFSVSDFEAAVRRAMLGQIEEEDALTPEQMKEIKEHITAMAEQACRRAVHALLTGQTGQWAHPDREGWEFYTPETREAALVPLAESLEDGHPQPTLAGTFTITGSGKVGQ